jgi:hypothetical protein
VAAQLVETMRDASVVLPNSKTTLD